MREFAYKPASGPSQTRGGILILWNECRISCSGIVVGEFHITASVHLKDTNVSFRLTVVYGPSHRADKLRFLNEIKDLKPAQG
jgi:hypothetical protein